MGFFDPHHMALGLCKRTVDALRACPQFIKLKIYNLYMYYFFIDLYVNRRLIILI